MQHDDIKKQQTNEKKTYFSELQVILLTFNFKSGQNVCQINKT